MKALQISTINLKLSTPLGLKKLSSIRGLCKLNISYTSELLPKGDILEEWFMCQSFFFFFFFGFLPFLGPLPRHMEVPRLGVESEL